MSDARTPSKPRKRGSGQKRRKPDGQRPVKADSRSDPEAGAPKRSLYAPAVGCDPAMCALLDAMIDAVIVIGEDGIIEFFSRAAEQIFGYAADEVLGINVSMLMPEPYRNEHDSYIRHYTETGAARVVGPAREVSGMRRDGSVFPIELSLSEMRWDDRRLFVGVARDISRRRQAEDAFKASEEKFRTLANYAPAGIFLTDAAGDCRYVNERWCEMAGLSPQEVLGRSWVQALHPDDRAVVSAAWYAAAAEGREFTMEYRFMTPAGKITWLHGSAAATRDGQGQIIGYVGTLTDISERRHAEDALKQSAQEIHDLYNRAPCGYHSLDKDGIFVRINDTELSWLGYEREEMVGKMHFSDVITAASANTFRRNFPLLMERGYVRHLKFNMVRKDGSTLPVLLNATALRDAQGIFRMSRSTLFDMSGQAQAEQAQRESEERYRLLAEYSNDMIARLSPEGMFTYLSPASAVLLGYEPESLQGRSSFDLVHPRDIADVRRAFFGVLQHYTLETITYRIKDREGCYIWVETSLRGVRRNGSSLAVEIVAVFRNVTDRVRATEALNRFKHVLDNTLDMLFLFEPDTLRFVYMNRGAVESLGYSREELLEMTPHQIKPRVSEKKFRKLIAPLLSGAKPSLTFETVHRCKNGNEFPVDISLQLVKDEDEKGLFVALVRDISERKRTEQVIRGLNRHLRQRNVELEVTNQELEAFSHSISHDLRAPLRSVSGFSDALLEEYGDKVDERGKGYLQRVRKAGQRMGALIDDLLNLSRVTRYKMRREHVDLSRLAQKVVAELKAHESGRRVQFVIAANVTADGDPGLLQIVMENLLDNAWKYTSKHATARIEFGITEREGKASYFVRDDGAGFNMAYAGKLFGAFQRLHGEGEFPGTGIGLATVHRIVRRHGGQIWAEGEVERGATFYFTLGSSAAGDATEG